MACSVCNCINKLEHVEKVINDYDPNENFINYKLLTIWLNRKTKQSYILVSKEGGVAVWEPINLDINAIEKILTDCGEIQPTEQGEIIVKGNCGIRAVAEGCEDLCITIRTQDPLTGGGMVCAGEELELGINTQIVGDVVSADSSQVGDVAIFTDSTGKKIAPSNINSVDGLTKITKSTSGEQLFRVETIDGQLGSNAGIEVKSNGNAYPYFQLSQDDTKFRQRINPETGALEIRPSSDLSKDSILTMLPNGVMLMPWQPKLGAKLGTTPYFTAPDVDIVLGSNKAFDVILDQDGFNLEATNFYPGDGSGQGAYYKTNYGNAFYLVSFQFLVQKQNESDQITSIFRIKYTGNEGYVFRSIIPPNISYNTCTGLVVIKSQQDGRITITFNYTGGNCRLTQFFQPRENYLGIYMLG